MKTKGIRIWLIAPALVAVGLLSITSFAMASDHGSGLADARRATARFHDLEVAQAAGHTVVVQDVFGATCIAQPGEGAMGVHYLNPALVDDAVSATSPEALVYEPRKHGRLKLVALEYLVFQEAWDATHSEPPSLFGEEFMLNNGSRYGLPPFYAHHAWIWKHNPSGMFAPWNPRVHCD